MNIVDNIRRLRALSDEIWKCRDVPDRFGVRKICEVVRHITGDEVRFIYRCVCEYKLVVEMYSAGNRGIGIHILEPDQTMGEAPFPGVKYPLRDLKPIINIWEDHIYVFRDEPIEYRFRTWCKAKGYYDLGKKHQFFSIFANRPDNLDMMKRYRFKKPFIKPVSHFEY